MDAGQIKRTRHRVAMSPVAMSPVAVARVAVLQHVAFDKSGLGIEERAQVADRNGGPHHRSGALCGLAKSSKIPVDRCRAHGEELHTPPPAVVVATESQLSVVFQGI